MDFIAKIAIGVTIAAAEEKSPLQAMPSLNSLYNIEGLADTWLYPFGQMLTTDVRRSNADEIFTNISIINFNYDRSVEVAVPSILQAAYGFDRDDALKLAGALTVYHPYGSLGTVDFRGNGEGTPYGSIPFGKLASFSQSLRTFTEKMEETEEILAMRRLIEKASNIVFLGFGYHRQNLELIDPQTGVGATTFLGTVYGESGPAIQAIRQDLQSFCMPPGKNGLPAVDLQPMRCADLLHAQYRRLTS
ncbi:hypothetical protein GCM10011380_15480 [Sphingomonas metalli]|uniref:Uncharacterized protein n=2 Tax=Sphingomonas metalli TaxID=1779358 RepID=A0A916T245_9SPHN|nr:hypothetical protein GCM10011380_15480 [Sphingomonas metalli]